MPKQQCSRPSRLSQCRLRIGRPRSWPTQGRHHPRTSREHSRLPTPTGVARGRGLQPDLACVNVQYRGTVIILSFTERKELSHFIPEIHTPKAPQREWRTGARSPIAQVRGPRGVSRNPAAKNVWGRELKRRAQSRCRLSKTANFLPFSSPRTCVVCMHCI
jgi:hypothetical protein